MPHWAKSVLSVVLAIALAVCIAALQESQKSANENQGTEQHEPHPEAATSTAPWLVILKSLYPGGLEEISEYRNAHSEEEKKKWPQAYYCELKVTDVWIVLFTGVLAFVTFLLVRATIRLWNATVENERPWVGPITANCDQIIVGQPSRGTIVIKNTGRSPALRMRVAHRGIILNQGQAPPSTPNLWEVPKALFPNAVDSGVAIRVADEDKIALACKFVACIADDAILGGCNRRPLGHREVDAVVPPAVQRGAEASDNASLHRPTKYRQCGSFFCRLHAIFGLGLRSLAGGFHACWRCDSVSSRGNR